MSCKNVAWNDYNIETVEKSMTCNDQDLLFFKKMLRTIMSFTGSEQLFSSCRVYFRWENFFVKKLVIANKRIVNLCAPPHSLLILPLVI